MLVNPYLNTYINPNYDADDDDDDNNNNNNNTLTSSEI